MKPSFKVVFAEKILADPMNSTWNPLKKMHPLRNAQNVLPKLTPNNKWSFLYLSDKIVNVTSILS